jgi:UDP-2,3-diacylglucosamine pyrophosphatase LpxH
MIRLDPRQLDHGPNHAPIPVRALFLSDFHFGYKGVDGAAILNCLNSYLPQKIYLAGDIIDGWKLAKRWHWRADYTRVLDALVDHKRKGCKIIYLPGNHDEAVRKSAALRRARFAFLSGIRICNSCVHRMKDGRRLLVLHGDQFDNALIGGAVSKLGDRLYDWFSDRLGLAHPSPQIMIGGVLRPFSLAKALMKRSSKAALRLLNNLEGAAERMMRRRGVDGLVFGHTHVPALKLLKQGKIFANCGMWMGHTNTAIIETLDGALELIRWPDMRCPRTPADTGVTPQAAMRLARYRETIVAIGRIRQMWDLALAGERLSAQAPQSEVGIVDHEGGHAVDIGGLAALGDEIAAQARRLQIGHAEARQDATREIHAAKRGVRERQIPGHTAEEAQHQRQAFLADHAGV